MVRPETKTVGLVEARNKLSELIESVMEGGNVVITRHGTPVARLVPYQASKESGRVREAIVGLRRLRKGMRLHGVKPRDLIDEGRA